MIIKTFANSIDAKKISKSEVGDPVDVGIGAVITAGIQSVIAIEHISPSIRFNRVIESSAVVQESLLDMDSPTSVLGAMKIFDDLLSGFFSKKEM